MQSIPSVFYINMRTATKEYLEKGPTYVFKEGEDDWQQVGTVPSITGQSGLADLGATISEYYNVQSGLRENVPNVYYKIFTGVDAVYFSFDNISTVAYTPLDRWPAYFPDKVRIESILLDNWD